METSEYLEQLLLRYEETYDIYKPYYIDGKEYPAYGYFTSDIREQNPEKNGKLWASAGYEHILFLTADKITQEHVNEALTVISDYMEPRLVRKDGRIPDRKHLYSFLTVLLLSQYPPDKNAIKAVKRYSFEKDYHFKLRGFCTGQLVLASMEDQKIVCSHSAEKKRSFLQKIFEGKNAVQS